MSKQRKLGFRLTLKATASRNQIEALPAKDQADLAYDVFGAVADQLTDYGIDPGLIAHAASDLGFELKRLDGSPRRFVRLPGSLKGDR
jgi:hypothetical protein